MTTNIADIEVTISSQYGITRKVKLVGFIDSDSAFILKKLGFNTEMQYFDEDDNAIDLFKAPDHKTFYVDNTTLVDANGLYDDNGAYGEFDWLVTAFQTGGIDFETFVPFVIDRWDDLGKFN